PEDQRPRADRSDVPCAFGQAPDLLEHLRCCRRSHVRSSWYEKQVAAFDVPEFFDITQLQAQPAGEITAVLTGEAKIGTGKVCEILEVSKEVELCASRPQREDDVE